MRCRSEARSSRNSLNMESMSMSRTLWIAFVVMGVVQIGCGSKSDPGTADANATSGQQATRISEGFGAPPAPASSAAPSSVSSTHPSGANPLDAMVPLSSLNLANPTKPEEVVGAFLDGMRTGNAAVIEGLLSTRARKEIADKGLDISPIGSPQARFEIGLAQVADPKDPNTMLVSSNWLEPGENGQMASEYEVVWALIKEPAGWRICEMAVDTHQAGEEIQVVNFENLSDVVPAGNAPAGNVPPNGAPPASAPRTASNPNPAVPPPALQPSALPQSNLPATGLPQSNVPPSSLPQSNLPAVNPPARGSLPALPNGPGNSPGSLPPLPPAGFGGGPAGQPGGR